jgi:hypothetical protein
MPLENICRSVKVSLDGTSYPISVGMRNAGTPTPCLVYEINSATCDMRMAGPIGLQHWTVDVEVVALAETVEQVTQMADEVLSLFNSGPINDTTNDCSVALGSFAVAFTTETPDDGQQDAVRIGTMSLTLLVQED